MTLRQNRLIATSAAVLLLVGAPALGQGKQDNPHTSYIVINNSNQQLSCAWKLPGPGKPWHGWFQIPAGANWTAPASGAVSFQCARPVKKLAYVLQPGLRYSLLRASDGSVDLIRVTTGR